MKKTRTILTPQQKIAKLKKSVKELERKLDIEFWDGVEQRKMIEKIRKNIVECPGQMSKELRDILMPLIERYDKRFTKLGKNERKKHKLYGKKAK